MNILFVSDFMFQAGPAIHGNGAKLYFDLHHPFFVMKKDRNLNNQVQTAITVFLWICNIIFSFDKNNIILLQEYISQHIDIGNVGTDDPNTSNIINVAVIVFRSSCSEGFPETLDEF